MRVLAICGSRNREGQTAKAMNALMVGVAEAGGIPEAVFLPELRIERCRQCENSGWGKCRREGQCVIDDDFRVVLDKAREADALTFVTPVYFSDLSESMRSFLDRLRRVSRSGGNQGIQGKKAIGICVAGGGGGGAPACAASLERALTGCGLDVVDMVPARRQNLEMKTEILRITGRWVAGKIPG